jgi:hypothetical protein
MSRWMWTVEQMGDYSLNTHPLAAFAYVLGSAAFLFRPGREAIPTVGWLLPAALTNQSLLSQ